MTMTLYDQVPMSFEYKFQFITQKSILRLSAQMNQFILFYKMIGAVRENRMEEMQAVRG
jgi:hypothetical protein